VAARAARVAIAAGRSGAPEPGSSDRIDSLKRDLESIRGKEQSVLGELERLDAELQTRRAVVDEADTQLSSASAAVEAAAQALAALQARQDERRRYMRFRLREIYKRGPGAPLRLLAGDEAPGERLRAARYAAYLGHKDREFLSSFRADAERLTEETQGLLEQRKEI
jgi:septal ring factor EnvC (AmiA/AmiB activator)